MNTKQLAALARFILVWALVSVLTLGAVTPASAAGTIRRVKPGSGGAGDGSSWANAYHDLQTALTAAGTGDQIWVASGVYTPGGARTDSFTLEDGVAIYGGFAGTEALLSQRNPTANLTILSGDIGTPGDATDNTYHVVTGSGVANTAILDGFTVRGGNADGGTADVQRGGAFYNVAGSPKLTNITFRGNEAVTGGGVFCGGGGSATFNSITFSGNAATYGGGMANLGSSPTLTTATFSGNSAVSNGGGMYNSASDPAVTSVTFSGNWANQGGGMYNASLSQPSLTNVTFTGNWANSGGAMNNDNSTPALSNVTFRTNWATYGGAIYDYQADPTLTNVTFTNNSAGDDGGGMFNYQHAPTLSNVTFSGNTAASDGGGIHNDASGPTLTNVTFNGNTAADLGGGMDNINFSTPTLSNVTFTGNWAQSGGGIFCTSSTPNLTNVTISGNGAQMGAGMYSAGCDPTLTNVTFSKNSASTMGGAMYTSGTSFTVVQDSIFWGDGTELVGSATSGPLTDVILQGGGCPITTTCTNIISTDPKLESLFSNGGLTQTMALGAGSSAIDAGGANSSCASKDQRGVTRPQGGKCDIGAYEVKTLTFKSVGANDGWLLESTETSGVGGTMDSASSTIRLGDDASNKQYRGLLSFDTSSLADTATVVLARVKIKKQGISGTDPFTTHGTLALSAKKPYFGTAVALEIGDFQAALGTGGVSSAGSISSTLVSGWYAGLLNAAGFGVVNKTGTTQLRLGFTTDDNNDHGADYLSFYSGNASSTYRPLLIVYYNP